MIQKKILEICREISQVQRDKKIESSKASYNVTSFEAVHDLVREQMVSRGIIMYPFSMEAAVMGTISTVTVGFRMFDTEDDTSIDIMSAGSGWDNNDKHTGKAMTYALKYAYKHVFMLKFTDDDPDLQSSDKNAVLDRTSRSGLTLRINTAVSKGFVPADKGKDYIASLSGPDAGKDFFSRVDTWLTSLGI